MLAAVPLDSATPPPLTLPVPATPAPAALTARPHLAVNAMMEARRAAPGLAGLAAAVLPRLPRRPRASQNLRAITVNQASAPMLQDDAVTCPWLAWDSQTHRNALLIDIDHADALDRWIALPEAIRPVLVMDPWTGRAHAVAVLDAPALLCTHAELAAAQDGRPDQVPEADRARLGPQMMADLAGRLLAAALGGTLLPPGSLTKSPWGQTCNLIGARRQIGPAPVFPEAWQAIRENGLMWHTLPGAGPVGLRDLVRALAGTWWHETAGASPRFSAARYAKKRGDPSWLSRNTWVFDLTRWWAYDRAERDGAAIQDAAAGFNAQLAQPLPAGDVRATARSIARFMVSRYRPRAEPDARRGRDQEAGADLSPGARKILAGQRTAAARGDATTARVWSAVPAVLASGGPFTQQALAAAAGVSVRTVAARWTKANMQDAALSGSAAVVAPLPAFPPESLPSSLAAIAAASRAARLAAAVAAEQAAAEVEARHLADERAAADRAAACAVLAAYAAAAARPGAEPEPLPRFPADVAAAQDVREARRTAEDTARAARRRAEARVARYQAAARAGEMDDRLATSRREAWIWWREQLADLDQGWDAREHGAADARERGAIRVRREAVITGRWRAWNAAVRRADRRPPPNRATADVEAQLAAIPW